jgi:hypothetical protein
MLADHEVIDVEEFHENLQRNSSEELKRKNHKLNVENKRTFSYLLRIMHIEHAPSRA